MQYTPSQQQAILATDQHLQIIACAGSGKTQVISERTVELLKKGVKPAQIVAFTYTEKAAGELKDRIYHLCLEGLGTNLGLAEMFVGTLHGYCLNLLQSPPVYRFLKHSVLTEVQQRLFIDHFPAQSGLTSVPFLQSGKRLQRWKHSRLYSQVLSILEEGNVDHHQIPPAVEIAARQYHQLRDKYGYLDYTTMVSEALSELRNNPALRNKIAGQLRYLIIDEYQDINPLQEKLIHELHLLGATLCVVGDDDQTIYQWRGSDVKNIIDFASRYPSVQQIALNENFRSSIGIVHVARQVIERNPQRLPKKMESQQTQPYVRGDILALDFVDPEEEATWIVRKIQALYGTPYQDTPGAQPRGLTYADFAVLLRVWRDAGPIRAALDAASIPYVIAGMNDLFEAKEIQALCAVFFFLADFHPSPSRSTEPPATFVQFPVTSKQVADLLTSAGLTRSDAHLTKGMSFLEAKKRLITSSPQKRQELHLQRVYLDFLQEIELREEGFRDSSEDTRSSEILFYNLGKLSQAISDFEGINFRNPPGVTYPEFAKFLYAQVTERSYYPEGWEGAGYATPDAVQIMTVHQAKGRQWPAVFVPCLRQNRFPSKRQGGWSVWHVLPESCVPNTEQIKGTVEDERRLFYVALTRAEKYLFCSWAPIASNPQQRHRSPFLTELTSSDYVLTRDPGAPVSSPLTPKGHKEVVPLELTFSELKYYFECPYSFKLRFLYGFNPPIEQTLGYGKSLHNALTELHAESLKGNIPSLHDIPQLIATHMHLPYATDPRLEQTLRQAAQDALSRYLEQNRPHLSRLEHVEKVVELKLEEGIVVHGRIDLIRRTDTNEVAIVDFKTQVRSQAEDISQKQLYIYAVGYRQLEGRLADLIEVHNMDDGVRLREIVDEHLMQSTIAMVMTAGQRLRVNNLPRLAHWCGSCDRCDMAGICRSRP
jgi:DNA helicase-2/ATP-dependent DNA helicase PcrA